MDSVNKSERLMAIEALLLSKPDGYTRSELARKLSVNRSTIGRDLPALGSRFAVYETDDGYLRIDRENYPLRVRFTLHEAMALHLAARLLATRMDKKNPHAAGALRKLGISLEKLAPTFSAFLKRSADVLDDDAQRQDPRYLLVLEQLTLAWAEQRLVRLRHSGKDERAHEYLFAIYFIEPYAVGQTTHVLGVHGPHQKPITFKIERIEHVEILPDHYELPANFDADAHLRNAWGIWQTNREPVTVALRFHPRVARRVQESRWHRNETVETLPDGYLLWQAQVAEVQEMLPWIRGWGMDVEVLEPKELRETIMGEVRSMAQLYGWHVSASPAERPTLADTFSEFFG